MPEDEKIDEQAQEWKQPATEESSMQLLASEKDKIISGNEEHQFIASTEPQTDLMEVHHHGHVHEQKKWKEYLFQFFMLFLAVFCGFLAEYQLEHVIENNREKQFMESLVKDLELDTVQLNNIKTLRLANIQRIDSSIVYFTSTNANAIPLNQYQFMVLGLRSFYHNSGTMDQLKHSGGLRLIRKRNVVDSIEAYDQQIKRMVLRDDYETEKIKDNGKIVEKMIDGRIMAKLYADTAILKNSSTLTQTHIPIAPQYIGEYLNSVVTCRSSYANNLSLQNTIRRRATNLIQLIKDEYKLER